MLAASRILAKGVDAVKAIVPAFTTCKKPADASEHQALVAAVAEQLGAVEKLGSSGPRSPYQTHFKLVSEAAQSLAWVAYSGPGMGEAQPASEDMDRRGLLRGNMWGHSSNSTLQTS